MKLLQRLKLARQYIAEGWIQGSYSAIRKEDGRACFCASGALAYVRTGNEFCGAAPRELAALGFPDNNALFKWNDDKRRTHASVVRRFDAAIKALSREEK